MRRSSKGEVMGDKYKGYLCLNYGRYVKEKLKIYEQKINMVKAKFLKDHFWSSKKSSLE